MEWVIVLGNDKLKSNHTYTKNSLVTPTNSKMPKNHKAVMHPMVAKHFLENFTQPNDLILDPFMGTGTTAVECIKLGRNYCGVEMVQEYVLDAQKRIDTTILESCF